MGNISDVNALVTGMQAKTGTTFIPPPGGGDPPIILPPGGGDNPPGTYIPPTQPPIAYTPETFAIAIRAGAQSELDFANSYPSGGGNEYSKAAWAWDAAKLFAIADIYEKHGITPYANNFGIEWEAAQSELAAWTAANPMPVMPVALATGGIVTKPTIALIGEAGPEAVIPLRGHSSTWKSQIDEVNIPQMQPATYSRKSHRVKAKKSFELQ